jgi:hypothetical protein
VLAQFGTCSGPVVEKTSLGDVVELAPGTYRPVLGGTVAVGTPSGNWSSSVSLQVQHAITTAVLSQFTRSWNGVMQETTFPYFTLLETTQVRARARAAGNCGTARLNGAVYFEKIG